MPEADTVPVIAVDGPASAGKGTVCAMLHRWLGWQVLDSGLLYRAAALTALDAGLDAGLDVDAAAEEALMEAVAGMDCRLETAADGTVLLWLAGREQTAAARSERAAAVASAVARIASLRKLLLPYQRRCAAPPGLIADGRDMGTVVFPQASLKIFLQADSSVRTERRHKQLKDMGIAVSIQGVSEGVHTRDRSDSERSASPLAVAADAHVIDTTSMDEARVMRAVTGVVSERLGLALPGPDFF